MAAKRRKKKKNETRKEPLFTVLNYKLMGLGLFLVMFGFSIMYMENEVNGFISLFISPLVILSGYGIVLYAIMKRDTNEPESTSSTGASGKPAAS